MKILIATENFMKGGMDTIIVELCNNWPHSDDEIAIVCNKSHPGIETYKNRIKRHVSITEHSWPFFAEVQERIPRKWWRKILIPFVKYGLFLYNVLAFKKYFMAGGFDRLLVVNGGYPAGDTCRAAAIAGLLCMGARSVDFNIHNLASSAPKLQTIPEYLIDRLVAKSCKSVMVVSRSVKESLKLRPGMFGHCHISVVYNGVAAKDQKGPDAGELFAHAADERYLLMMGTYESRKGHDFLLKVFEAVWAKHPKIHLVFCGHGSASQIEEVAALVPVSLRNRVHLLPFLAEPGNLLAGAYLLLSGSQEYESFGLTVIEAGNVRVPAVVTNVGGLPEVVENGVTGFVAERADVDAFAACVMNLLNDSVLRSQMGLAAKLHAQNFTPEVMAEQYARFVRSDAGEA